MAKRIDRRDILRAVPIIVGGSALAGVARLVVACTDDDLTLPDRPLPMREVPTDDDELVKPNGEVPTNAGETPPTVPNPVWIAVTSPSVKFTLPFGVATVVAYEWCTLHGLWKAAPLGV